MLEVALNTQALEDLSIPQRISEKVHDSLRVKRLITFNSLEDQHNLSVKIIPQLVELPFNSLEDQLNSPDLLEYAKRIILSIPQRISLNDADRVLDLGYYAFNSLEDQQRLLERPERDGDRQAFNSLEDQHQRRYQLDRKATRVFQFPRGLARPWRYIVTASTSGSLSIPQRISKVVVEPFNCQPYPSFNSLEDQHNGFNPEKRKLT